MALTSPTGLSAAQKRKLEQNDPIMSDNIGIPEAVATETDLNNVISELASNAAGKGASCIGIEDSGGIITATTVEGALAEIVAAAAGTYETVGNITAVNGGDAASAGVRNTIARGDHQHAVATAAPTVTAKSEATAASEGSATSLMRSDAQIQAATAAPTTALTGTSANAQGTASTLARSDHSHQISSVTSTAGGAGNADKLLKLDGTGKADGRNLSADGAVVDAAAAGMTAPATVMGLLWHIQVNISAIGDVDTVMPTGTWRMVDVQILLRATAAGSVQVKKVAPGPVVNAITNSETLAGSNDQIVWLDSIDDAYSQLIGGTDQLRVSQTGANCSVEIHMQFRKVA